MVRNHHVETPPQKVHVLGLQILHHKKNFGQIRQNDMCEHLPFLVTYNLGHLVMHHPVFDFFIESSYEFAPRPG